MAFAQDTVNDLFQKYGVLKVTFTKKDNSQRTMVCTKDMARVPVKDHPKSSVPKEMPPGLMNVYEIDNGWRSFHCDKILRIDQVD